MATNGHELALLWLRGGGSFKVELEAGQNGRTGGRVFAGLGAPKSRCDV